MVFYGQMMIPPGISHGKCINDEFLTKDGGHQVKSRTGSSGASGALLHNKTMKILQSKIASYLEK